VTTPNPQFPDPNAVAGYNPQQVPGPQQVPAPPQVEYAPVEAMQPDMQQSWGQMPVGAGVAVVCGIKRSGAEGNHGGPFTNKYQTLE